MSDWDDLFYAIDSAHRIGIFFHTYPDWDCLGSAFALRQIIVDNFPNKSVRVFGDRKGKLFFLGLEGISTQTTLPETFRKKDSLAIIVDCWKEEKIECSNLLKRFERVAIIDHHEPYEKQLIVFHDSTLYIKDTKKISCSEVILDWAFNNELEINQKAATFLYCGLFGDSQGFTNPNINSETFNNAKKLLELGADITTINQNIEKKDLIHEKLRSQLIFLGKLKKRFFYSVLTQDLIETYSKRFNTETRLFYIVHSINIRGADIVGIYFKYLGKLVINIQKRYNSEKIKNKGYMSLRNNGKSYSYVKSFDDSTTNIEEELEAITNDCLL